jgi:BolA protein
MSVSDTIKKKLVAQFKPTNLEIIDESHLHSGHVGARPEGETHFRLIISSETLAGRTRIEKQRLIYKALKEELAGPIHALSIQAD